MKKDKVETAIMECYVELYKHSTPKADFNKLMKDAKLNDRGQKIIPFMDYEIDEKKYTEILEKTIKKYKLNSFTKRQFEVTVALGVSPTFKK